MSGCVVTIKNGVAFVGRDLEPVELGEVRMEDGRVASITSHARRDNGRVVDARGGCVIPGLVDAHVHLSLAASSTPFETWNAGPPALAFATYLNGLAALRAGVTAVRDLGCPDDTVLRYQQLVDRGDLLGPRTIAAGRMIMITGGHVCDYGRQADGPDDVRRAVREQLRDGASLIKVMATGGFSSATDAGAIGLSREEIAAAVGEAHAHRMRVAAHAHSDEGIENAVRAGADTIEHAAQATAASIELLRSTDTPLVPTLCAVAAATADEPEDREGVERLGSFRRSVQQALRGGVRIVAGTDSGTANNPIGSSLIDELLEYVALGMEHEEALKAATVYGADAVGGGVGVLEEGGVADLLVVDSDPRQDVSTLRNVGAVVARGRVVDLGAVRSVLAANRLYSTSDAA